jgi:small subunit ribosomal protein S6
MPTDTTVYDLTLLLSTAAPEETRAKILADVEAAIQRGGGSIVGQSDWGARNLAYRIERQADAEFHLLQITAPPSLLNDLGHNLHITDGVLRFRIIKAVPGSRLAAAASAQTTTPPAVATPATAATTEQAAPPAAAPADTQS